MRNWAEILPVSAEVVRGSHIAPLTPEWFHARRGRLTASKRADVIARFVPKQLDAMAAEILHEVSDLWELREISAAALDWGRKNEPIALEALSYALGEEIVDPGFILHKDFDYVGSTPDGYIGDSISVQVKCPYNPAIHMETRLTRMISRVYFHQVQWEMWTSGRKECLFTSFDPRCDPENRLAIISVDRDEKLCDAFYRNTVEFAHKFQLGATFVGYAKRAGIDTALF